MDEVWKKIDGYEAYSVSNYGNVKRDKKKSGEYLKLYKKQETDKNRKKTNYFTYWINLTKEGKCKQFKVSRLVALAFIPNPNNLPIVHHIDCNPLNNNVDNLEWVSFLENTQSINTQKPFGCINKSGPNCYCAEVGINGKIYKFSSRDRDNCEDWLQCRKIEVVNNLNLTEIEREYKGKKSKKNNN